MFLFIPKELTSNKMGIIIKIENELVEVSLDTRTKRERNMKPVLQYSLEGGLIGEYPSVASAQRETGIQNISDCILGRRKTAGGYIWKAAEGENNE